MVGRLAQSSDYDQAVDFKNRKGKKEKEVNFDKHVNLAESQTRIHNWTLIIVP